MSTSAVVTPQMARVQSLADQALNMTDGLTVMFRVDKYGSLAACKTAARGMQVSFCNLRVRARRVSLRRAGESSADLLSAVKGEYDNLACVVRPLPNNEGFSCALIPAMSLDIDLEVIDNSTGKPLPSEDPVQNRFIMLMGKLIKEDTASKVERRKFLNPYTTEELQFMWEYDADTCREMNVPTLAQDAEQSARDYEGVDLASLDEAKLEIVNPPESE